MYHTRRIAKTSPRPASSVRLRLTPSVHLCSGDAVGAVAEHAFSYDDRPFLANTHKNRAPVDACAWVGEKIRDLGVICDTLEFTTRPIILPIPARAIEPAKLLDACTHAVAQTHLCPQEISLELPDATLQVSDSYAKRFIDIFRRNGFRVSIDARKSWHAQMPNYYWLMIDTLRIKAGQIDEDQSLQDMIEAARTAGVAIIAEKPLWRQGDRLASLGIDYGTKPRSDA